LLNHEERARPLVDQPLRGALSEQATDRRVPARTEHQEVREHRDLLVVGSTRQADYGHATLGDAAAELLSRLECPLAIAPSGLQDEPCARLERIGVVFDATPEADAAIALARSLALAAGAELRVRQLIDTTPRRATQPLQGREKADYEKLYDAAQSPDEVQRQSGRGQHEHDPQHPTHGRRRQRDTHRVEPFVAL
jgi:nucleotide-binding universal stress UspA family protein